jgi:hypothetical protein
MELRRGEFERIRTVLAEANDDALTAREIHERLDARDAALDSPHRVATVLGRRADDGDIEVIESQPYRYRLVDSA